MKQFCVIREPRLAFGTPFIQKLCCTPFHSSQLQEIFSTSGFVRRNSCFSSTQVERVRNLSACSSCQQKQNVFTPHWKVLEAVPLTTSYFFEGYYFRITIPELNESFSFIYALERKSCGWVYTAQVLNEEGLLFHTFKNAQFWRHEDTFGMGQWQFDDRKEQEDIGIPRQLHPSVFFRKVPLGFQWTRRYHCGRLLDDKDSSFSCSWNIDITALDGWGSRGRNPQKSTASWLSHIPYLFDPGYQVLMAHGVSNGWLQWKGRSFPILDCPVYIEKNWGQRFPKKWFWLQCNSFFSEKDLSVTSVGAIRRVLFTPNGEETVGMLSIHHRGRHYLFTNWTCFYITWQVAPWGSWSVYAESSQYVAILRAWCDSPGQIVLGPSLNGLQPNTRESLFGHMRIQITEKNTQCKVVEDYSNFAAVEVGGQDKSCWRNIWTDSVFQLPSVLRNVVQYFDGNEE